MFKRNNKILKTPQAIHLTTIDKPNSVISEQVKTIRTNIIFSKNNLKSVMITSSVTGEGKSTVAANLAVEFAYEGRKTLLVDADLRRPTVHKTFMLDNIKGLSSWLAGQIKTIDDSLASPGINNLVILPSGPIPPNPAELLSSRKMREGLKSLTPKFDVLIIDGPPVLPVTDARILAPIVDGVVLVARQGFVAKKAVLETKLVLNRARANILGAVLNDVNNGQNSGYYGYDKGYGYYYGAK